VERIVVGVVGVDEVVLLLQLPLLVGVELSLEVEEGVEEEVEEVVELALEG